MFSSISLYLTINRNYEQTEDKLAEQTPTKKDN